MRPNKECAGDDKGGAEKPICVDFMPHAAKRAKMIEGKCHENLAGDDENRRRADTDQDGLKQTLNGEKLKYAEAMVLGKLPARKDIPYWDYSIYKNLPFAKTNGESTSAWVFLPLKSHCR